ncbi:hypothetical protein GGF46_002471 [Coemansia sp. RSA 552]|nr:hypothetical protein GGF46_002471 [Coemansia sp. RSA 552]
MKSCRRPDVQSIDKDTFEQLLLEGVRDPTPVAVRSRHADSAMPPPRKESMAFCSRTTAGDAAKQGYVLRELVDTELAYVKDLEIMVAVLTAPLCKGTTGSWPAHSEQMLHPLQALLSFQHRFATHLQRCNGVLDTAQLFLSQANRFSVYLDYCSTYHWLCDVLERFKAESGWPDFLAKSRGSVAMHSDRHRLGLRDFLIKPVQRICKYPLFLRELLKTTDERTDPVVVWELSQALARLRSVCEGVNQVQQRIDALRLRNTLLSSYSDNMELPLDVVARLGDIVLSGPLHISSCAEKAPGAPRLLGCVLFKRFLLILRSKRSKGLVPQFWFPLHTMRAMDDGMAHSWRLQHIKSGQYMVLQAGSPHEKQAWVRALDSAINTSTSHVRRRREKDVADQQTQLLVESVAAQAIPVLGPAVSAAAPQSPKGSVARSLCRANPFALARPGPGKKYFREFTSPEILRLHAVEELRHGSGQKTPSPPTPHIPSPPHVPCLAKSLPSPHSPNKDPESGPCTGGRPSRGSYPSHVTAVDNDVCSGSTDSSGDYGVFSASSTCNEPIRIYALQDTHSSGGGHPPAEPAKDTFSGRLLGAIGNFQSLRRNPAPHIHHREEY